ncbi:peptidoglycan DD-metalloendopeptidase family protein [Romeriopsis navalis]|nr:peptidoglycan DD-metalloendopeptidase family protein [Romeriopsis navalis]
MLGIAISVGAGSIAAPVFQHSAHATEPVSTQISVETPVAPILETTKPVSKPVAIVPQPAAKPAKSVLGVSSKVVVVKPSAKTKTLTSDKAVKTAVKPTAGHAVAKGETLWQIAQAYKVEVRALANVNRLSTGSVLKVGQVLNVPVKTAVKPSQDTISLKEISKSVPEVPVLASSKADGLQSNNLAARQAVAVENLRVKRDRLKQDLAELGEDVNGAPKAFAEAKLSIVNAADQQESDALPVTRLSDVALPSIGGVEPKAIVTPDLEPLSVESTESVSERPQVVAKVKQLSPETPQFDPTPLLAEIRNLRERQPDAKSEVTTTPKQVAVIAQATPAKLADDQVSKVSMTRVEPISAKAVAANPDFAGRKSESALSIELRNFVQPKLKSETKEKSAPSTNRQVVARATFGSAAYAPVTPAVQKMVAPNLPAMGREDAFLPGGKVSKGYIMPSKGLLSSGYGWRWGRMHRGIDIAAPVGTPIVASAAGRVSYARWNNGGYGYLVELEHEDGTMTRYAHNSRILVKEGQEVAQGQQISAMGSTGFSTGPHLHFEIHKRGRGAVNPMAFLSNQS